MVLRTFGDLVDSGAGTWTHEWIGNLRDPEVFGDLSLLEFLLHLGKWYLGGLKGQESFRLRTIGYGGIWEDMGMLLYRKSLDICILTSSPY